MYLHIWEKTDDSVFQLNATLEPIVWDKKSLEELILELDSSIPRLAESFYCASPREKLIVAAISIVFVYGGLYSHPQLVCLKEFPIPTGFKSLLFPPLLASKVEGNWLFSSSPRNDLLKQLLADFAAKKWKKGSVWNILIDSISKSVFTSEEIKKQVADSFILQEGAKVKDVLEEEGKEEKEEKEREGGKEGEKEANVWSLVVDTLKGKQGVTFSAWTKVFLGVGALIVIAIVVFFVWKRLDPQNTMSNTANTAKLWFQKRLKSLDKKIASSAEQMLDKIAPKI